MVTLGSSILGALIMIFAVYRTWSVLPQGPFLVGCAVTSVIGYWLSAIWPADGVLLLLKLVVLSLLAPVGFLVVAKAAFADLRQSLMRSPVRQPEGVSTGR